jgi:hypothetical protein
MGLIFKFGDDAKKMQPSEKISFGNHDFIADRLRNLCL